MKKAAAYLRSATVGQAETDRGRAAVQAYADAHGISVTAWYVDAGLSGLTQLSERPAGAALLRAAAEGAFSRVLVSGFDRVGRSAALVKAASAKLSAAGVRLESVTEGGLPEEVRALVSLDL